ncbi:zinc finger protein 644-like [Acipenser ruthenus]|uniref:zinc finger protein 644-like n=1 Tax=Acipenser ruthenus TaxID=7906 RepID=UPI002740A49B|nr:zinc finger protein 644-like [Acipenser ruthenus]XP_033876606.2 zinc finger protein 644-like [Acipenser ruthenus]XP_033876615.2 zinc finger protein 644-like [Acipenser ruthenus]XP_033876624.2 zinc finger protein 644-like [Acipenser ruthenus]XP_058887545.1 zinc finger protein 644-like [Acipenser ruthenus]XP_058887546.1 zinc finger protein 644-like [Acipenser ruthenus]XP_058887547.1 zinc finger protein 644-like [Acipenser ruthenus]
MADLKENAGANEETNYDCVSDRPNATPTSLKSQEGRKNNTSSLREQLSGDSYEKALNGAQPSLFVHSGVPAVSIEDLTLPKGTVVNGPVSHSTSNKLCVLKKGSVSLSAAQTSGQPVKVSSPEVSQRVHELKIPTLPAAQKTTHEPLLFFVPNIVPVQTLSGASIQLPSAAATESEVEKTSGDEEKAEETPVSETKKSEEIKMRNTRRMECAMASSESSSDEYDSDHDLNWDPQKEFMQFLLDDNDHDLEKEVDVAPQPTGERRRKRKMDIIEMEDLSENDYSDVHYPSKKSKIVDVFEYEPSSANHVSINKVHTYKKKPAVQTAVDSRTNFPCETVEAIKQLIFSSPAKKWRDRNSTVKTDQFPFVGNKFSKKKTAPSPVFGAEQEPSFYPCTKCNVNFKEKKHLHRHMMYHLDGSTQFRHVDVPRPFICKECGRSFRDRNSLLKHMVIHQERREKLMEEIKGLKELQDEGRNARLQCPQCVFGTNCPKTFVQHAKTHQKDKRYYCCEECNFMAVTEHELECHHVDAHGATVKPTYIIIQNPQTKGEKNVTVKYDLHSSLKKSTTYTCKICPFNTSRENVLKKHVEYTHQQQNCETSTAAIEQQKSISEFKKASTYRLQMNSKYGLEKDIFRKVPEKPSSSGSFSGLLRNNLNRQKARKGAINSLSAKWSQSSSTNKSSYLQRTDKQNKLFLHQQAGEIDVTTGCLYRDAEENYNERERERQYGNLFPLNHKKRNANPSYAKLLVSNEEESSSFFPGFDSDQSVEQSKDLVGRNLEEESYIGEDVLNSDSILDDQYPDVLQKKTAVVLQKLNPHVKEEESDDYYYDDPAEDSFEDTYDFSDYTSEATANFLDCSENEQNPYARNYFIRRQRSPVKGDRGLDNRSISNTYESDSGAIHTFKVKEECIETEVCSETQESGMVPHNDSCSDLDLTPFSVESKSCPYCPAIFESGVGLSNHVRGHLHRVGLNYNARHAVSPEQVASQDRKPRIRRKLGTIRRIKKAEKSESQTEHTCPLCGGWFDTKTGLSNHIRGHLRRIGQPKQSASKSPVCILNEIMQDKEEYKNIVKILNKKQFLSRPYVSQKFATSDGLFLSPTGIPVKIQHASQETKPWGTSASQLEEQSLENKPNEAKPVKSPPSSSLIELLKKKKKKMEEERDMNQNLSHTARKRLAGSPSKENVVAHHHPVKVDLSWQPEKGELNKKICVHCNTTFPSAVSLSNHVRAYARRKRAALLDGTTYDCKQRKPRSRPGTKKKMFPLPHTADETYRLTCRFCDLVFQGPLSVQEDWIKHLQRHIMNANVPRTGAGMVEVVPPKEVSSVTEQAVPLMVPQAVL